MYRQVWLIKGNETHSEGDNWRGAPAEERRRGNLELSGAEHKDLDGSPSLTFLAERKKIFLSG